MSETQQKPDGVVRQHGLRRRRRWSTINQNIEFEIESARSELLLLEDSARVNDANGAILEECWALLGEVQKAYDYLIPREFFIYQTLLLLSQKLILILPRDQLKGKWLSIRQRLLQLTKEERGQWEGKAIHKKIEKFLNSQIQDENGSEQDARALMFEMKNFLDDRLIGGLWLGISIRRGTYGLVVCSFTLLLLFIILVMRELECSLVFSTCGSLDNAEHLILTAAVAGALGGTLSAISFLSATSATAPPLVQLSVVRPIIGGVAGLFLYLVTSVGFADIKYPVLYGMAIAVGFSERLFYRTLNKLAAQAETDIGSATGQTETERRR